MRRGLVRVVLCLAVLPLCATWAAAAAPRAFAGSYELSDVHAEGRRVNLTMT